MYRKAKYIICIQLLFSVLPAQRDFNEELKSQEKSIEFLKKEMANLKNKIKEMANREKLESKKIILLEKEIALTDRLISELSRKEEITKSLISNSEGKIEKNENDLRLLKDRYKKRVIHAYKESKSSNMENLISTVSWRKSLYREKYLDIVSEEDKKISNNIRSLLIEIGQEKLNKEAVLRKNISLNRDKAKQKQKLKKKKYAKEKSLAELEKNKDELSNYLDEKSRGLKDLEGIRKTILKDKARFEREEKVRRQQEALKSKQFSQLKGQLPWPIKGRVVTKFGNQWNSKLKTTTDYPGIDIQGKADMPVKTVLNGVVATITYLRGYGTTVIIDHGGGFYTVYSQLKSLKTHVNSEVRSGDTIALIAESDTGGKPVLHFEIWKGGEKLNPEKWLSK